MDHIFGRNKSPMLFMENLQTSMKTLHAVSMVIGGVSNEAGGRKQIVAYVHNNLEE